MNGKQAKKLRRIVKQAQKDHQDNPSWSTYGSITYSQNEKVHGVSQMLDPNCGKSIYRKLKNAAN